MRYPFGPFPMRGLMRWPQGNQLATSVTINLEYWDLLKESSALDYAGGPAVLPDLFPGNIPDFTYFAGREYGQCMGDWSLNDDFVETETALDRRAVIDSVLEHGFELVPHNCKAGEACYRDQHASHIPPQAHLSS